MDYERLARYYLDLAERMLDEAFGENRRQWIQQVAAELPEIRRVFAWLEGSGDAERGLLLAYLLQELWFEPDYTEQGLTFIEHFLASDTSHNRPSLRAKSLDLAGALALSLNQLDLARSYKADAIALFRELGDAGQLGYGLLHQGHLLGYGQQDYVAAESHYREAMAIFAELNNEEGIAHAMANLAAVLLEQGNTETAQRLVNESLRRYADLGSQWDLALTIGTAAGVATAQGQLEQAARLAACSAAHRERIGVSLPVAFQSRFDRIERMATNGLDTEKREAAWAAGKAMTLVEAIERLAAE